MNVLINRWDILKVYLLREFNDLTQDDLNFAEGQEELLAQRLESKLGKGRGEIVDMLQELNAKMI
ncbi:hypothetical protein [Flexithrix dorotheae]|uniref:hypothetical protein n=1 Tax=Flexithrix dorotheae TaxID=70993 RepID=UPI000361C2F3|nr:hypothetical protein [Flexithrix dorotheae]